MSWQSPTRRGFIAGSAAGAAVLSAPAILRAQDKTLKITTWGGKWGEIMKGQLLPAFEKEFSCRVEVDSAFPFVPKLMASPRSDPIYDVLHSNSNDQWLASDRGLLDPKPTQGQVPNLADVYDYAKSNEIIGVAIFTSAIGIAYRTDQIDNPPKSWKDFWDKRFEGKRAGYTIPTNSLGQSLFMLAGKLYGSGFQDLDASFKAMEALKPIRLVDFTGTMEKQLLSGEAAVGVIHDSGVLRYTGQDTKLKFVAPSEGVLALEQVLSVTKGSKQKDLAYKYVDYMLRPDVQKSLAEGVWYSPANKKVELAAQFKDVLYDTPEEFKSMMQVPWQWYNSRKDQIDDRTNRIFR